MRYGAFIFHMASLPHHNHTTTRRPFLVKHQKSHFLFIRGHLNIPDFLQTGANMHFYLPQSQCALRTFGQMASSHLQAHFTFTRGHQKPPPFLTLATSPFHITTGAPWKFRPFTLQQAHLKCEATTARRTFTHRANAEEQQRRLHFRRLRTFSFIFHERCLITDTAYNAHLLFRIPKTTRREDNRANGWFSYYIFFFKLCFVLSSSTPPFSPLVQNRCGFVCFCLCVVFSFLMGCLMAEHASSLGLKFRPELPPLDVCCARFLIFFVLLFSCLFLRFSPFLLGLMNLYVARNLRITVMIIVSVFLFPIPRNRPVYLTLIPMSDLQSSSCYH